MCRVIGLYEPSCDLALSSICWFHLDRIFLGNCLHSKIFFLRSDSSKSRGKRPVKIILTPAANFSWKTLPILIIPSTIIFGSS